MAKAQSNKPAGDETQDLESRVIAFAEQVGWVVGLTQAKTEGWLDRANLADRLTGIRDSASDLLTQIQSALPEAAAAATRGTASGTASSKGKTARAAAGKPPKRDLAHAPGKQHRAPAPSRRGVKHSNQQIAKGKQAATLRRGRRQG